MGQTRLRVLIPIAAAGLFILFLSRNPAPRAPLETSKATGQKTEIAPDLNPATWLERFHDIDGLFHRVYNNCWEAAYGAIGDAHVFAVNGDSALLRFYTTSRPLPAMCRGTWVDDQAWVCLAEMYWWRFTGKSNRMWVEDAIRRYQEARTAGCLSHHEGFWSWYNWPPNAPVRERIFTNSNMNQMATVACWLYAATGQKRYLQDALLVWNGDKEYPGIEKTYYRGEGKWVGQAGLAAFGNPLPWEGAGYCSIGAAMFAATKDPRYKNIAVATAQRLMDPATGWVDAVDFYQLGMDGNGAFVHFILDAYQLAPEKLQDIPRKIAKSLDHVWTNAHGRASVTLHRAADNGIRNGWNPRGGEQGYGVDEVGTVHAQGEAVRAFGVFVYVLKNFR